MKRIVFFFIFLIIGCASILFQQQNEIIEEVSTDYWVVPLFAVDKDGKGVMDLNAPDIEVTVNNKKIENFTLLRRNFSTENNTSSNPVIESSNTGFTKPISTVSEKTRHVFLFFDTSFSSAESTRKSKIIARKLVENASNNTIFYVLGIEPLSGLIFYGGQTNDKTQIISIIDNIKPRANIRNPDKEEIFIPKIPNSRKGESDEEQIDYESKQVAEFYRFKIDRFQKSFESLYYAISPLKDNKFIYLFTQGISGFIQDKVVGGRSIIGHYISKISDSLGRSGAVLFIINPLFHDNLVSDRKREEILIADDSGDVALNSLAEKSGGKYFYGPEKYIIERIEKMNNAYYEVFFPASLKSGSNVLNISIKSKRPHVDIYTINSTEKDKEYDRMEEIERQILMLNIVSGNLIYKPGLKILDAQYKDGTNKKDTVSYEVILPDSFQGKQLDIYKVRLNKKNTVPNIEKESLSNAPKLLKVSFKNLTEGDDTYFTIINPLEKTCLVKGVKKIETLIHRDNWGDNSDEWATTKGLEKENASTKIEDQDELHRLLKGTADYCERLKKAAFHYICKEKIEENQRPLDRNGPIDINIGDQSKDNWNSTIILRTYATVGTRKNIKMCFIID